MKNAGARRFIYFVEWIAPACCIALFNMTPQFIDE